MDLPLVSIIIPTFNREKDLLRALQSVLAQTYQNWEALIVDNNSTDNTLNMIKQINDNRIKVFHINNKGIIAMSRNRGIREANGQYIAFLDSDDWWTPKKLEISIRNLDQGYDLVYHKLYVVKKRNFIRITTNSEGLENPVFEDLLRKGNVICNSSVVTRKSILDLVLGFAECPSLVGIEDYELWLRIAKISNKFKYLNSPLGFYWLGGGNTNTSLLSISNIKQLEDLYKADLLALEINKPISWIDYVKAREFFKMKNYSDCADLLGIVSTNSLKMKSIIYLYYMKLYIYMRFSSTYFTSKNNG